MMMDIKLDHFFCKVWSRHPSVPPSASAPDLSTHPLTVVGLEIKLPLLVGPAVAGHLEWLPLTYCCSSYDITITIVSAWLHRSWRNSQKSLSACGAHCSERKREIESLQVSGIQRKDREETDCSYVCIGSLRKF